MFKGISKESKVGSLTAIAITALILGYNYMIGRDNPFSGSRDFYVVYDSAQGLIESSPVMFNGFRIGQVRKMRMNEESQKIVATLEIYSHLNIPKDSRVKIESELLGGVKLKLNLGRSKKMASNKDTLLPEYAKDVMSMVNEKVAPIAAGVDSLVSNLNALIGRASVKKTFDELPVLVNRVSGAIDNIRLMIENLSPGINTSINNLASFSANLDNYSKEIDKGLKSFSRLSEQLDSIQLTRITQSLEETITSVSKLMKGIEQGDGTLGKLANDKALYESLVQTNESLQCLMNDIKSYPEKYIPLPWGKKQRKKAAEKSNSSNICFPEAPVKTAPE